MNTLILSKAELKLVKQLIEDLRPGTIFDLTTLSTTGNRLDVSTELSNIEIESLLSMLDYKIDVFGWSSKQRKLLQNIISKLEEI